MRIILALVITVLAMGPVSLAGQTMYSCSDFDSSVVAQRFLDFDPVRYGDLDPDGDGIACEGDELASSGPVQSASQSDDLPAPTAPTCDPQSLSQRDRTATSTLDGKLGGTLASFDAVYGEPMMSQLFREYAIPSCGTVFVQDYESSVVIDIMLFSPRADEDKEVFEPDDADWTISEAMTIAESFLPPDAVLQAPLGDLTAPAAGMLADDIEVRGSSQMLLESVPSAAWEYVDNSPTYGGLSYWLLRTYSGDVYAIVVQLAIED